MILKYQIDAWNNGDMPCVMDDYSLDIDGVMW